MAESVLGSERFAVETDDEIFDANFIIKSHTPEKVDTGYKSTSPGGSTADGKQSSIDIKDTGYKSTSPGGSSVDGKQSSIDIKDTGYQQRVTETASKDINTGTVHFIVYEFFIKARELKSKILIRASQDRKLSEESCKLWEHMESQDIKGRLEIEVPKKDKHKKRKAILAVRYGTITLNPPKHLKASEKKRLGTVTIDAYDDDFEINNLSEVHLLQ